MKQSFIKRADKLRMDCLNSLSVMDMTCKKSKYSYTMAYNIPNNVSDIFEELVWTDSKWQLYDNRGMLYDTQCLPLEQLCEIVDAVKEIEQQTHSNYHNTSNTHNL